MYRQEAVEILVEQTKFLYLNDDEGIPRHVRTALNTLKEKKEDSIYRQYFVLTEGKLVNIGDYGDWEAAHESANDIFGSHDRDWETLIII